MIRSIAKNVLLLLSSGIIFKGSLMLAGVLIARSVGPDEYGKFAFAVSFTAIFSTVADFGLSTLITRNVSRAKDSTHSYLSNSLFIKIILSAITWIIISLVLTTFNKSLEENALVYVISVFSILNSFNQYLFSFVRAHNLMVFESASKLVQSCFLVLSLALALTTNAPLITIALLYACSSIVGMIVPLVAIALRITTIKVTFDRKLTVQLLRSMLPFGLSALFVEAYYYVDTVILSRYKGDTVAGYYSSAYSLLVIVTFITATFIGVLLPVLSTKYKESKEAFLETSVKLFRLSLYISTPLLVLFAVLSSEIVRILLGERYAVSGSILQLLSISLFLLCNYAVFSVSLTVSDHQRYVTLASVFGAVFNICANLIVIPAFSYTGAAVVTILTEATVCFIIVYFYQARLNTNSMGKLLSIILKVLVPTVLMIIILAINSGVLGIILSLFCYTSTLLFLDVPSRQIIAGMLRLIRSKLQYIY